MHYVLQCMYTVHVYTNLYLEIHRNMKNTIVIGSERGGREDGFTFDTVGDIRRPAATPL